MCASFLEFHGWELLTYTYNKIPTKIYPVVNLLFYCNSNYLFSFLDFHRTHPYVISGSVDQTVKVWECR